MINRIFLSTLLVVFFAIALSAQETRSVQPFDHLRVSGRIEVRLLPSDREEVVLDVKGTEPDDVDIYNKGSVLYIRMTKTLYKSDIYVTVDIYYKNLREIEGLAGATIQGTAPIEAEKIRVNVRSGSIVDLEVAAQALDVTAAEGGEFRVSGTVTQQDVNANTGGVIHAFSLQSTTTYARAGTGGQLYVQAEETLDARASIGGHIEYRGDPKQKSTRSNLGGSIERG